MGKKQSTEDKRRDALFLQELISEAQKALNNGEVEAVKRLMAYDVGAERYLHPGLPLKDKVAEWVATSDGIFRIEDLYNSLNIRTEKEKNAASVVIYRMKKAGQIIKHGNKNGIYRKVAEELEEMEWMSADVTPLQIKWPLDIGTFFQAYPKNIGIIAGSKDAGKTAVLMDFVKKNMSNHKIHYYTNEMSKEELKVRILQHEDTDPDGWAFHAYECTRDHADHVARNPDDIHVIDYIEINENFYEIGNILKEIHEATGKGFVLVGLQKDYGSDLGRGASFSLQRPRLYITLERGFARCVSAKNRVETCVRSPIGDILFYGIVNGWKVITKGIWHPEMPGELDEYLGRRRGFLGGRFNHGAQG